MKKLKVIQVGIMGLRTADGNFGEAMPIYAQKTAALERCETDMVMQFEKSITALIKNYIDTTNYKLN